MSPHDLEIIISFMFIINKELNDAQKINNILANMKRINQKS